MKNSTSISQNIFRVLLGLIMLYIGIALAAFYIIIFPGNINEYIHEIDALRLYSEKQRILRLLFQPVLVFWALWSTGSLRLFFKE